jgi:hypothetical protein
LGYIRENIEISTKGWLDQGCTNRGALAEFGVFAARESSCVIKAENFVENKKCFVNISYNSTIDFTRHMNLEKYGINMTP